jgi:hypothetical protein
MPRPAGNKPWRTLTRGLAASITGLGEGFHLIIAHRHINYYVQVAGSDDGTLRIEAACNTYIEPPSAALTIEQYAQMDALGWRRATEDPPELATEQRDPNGSPNFYRDVAAGEDLDAVAELIVSTLRDVYNVATTDLLHYQAFHNLLGDFACPKLPIERRESATG